MSSQIFYHEFRVFRVLCDVEHYIAFRTLTRPSAGFPNGIITCEVYPGPWIIYIQTYLEDIVMVVVRMVQTILSDLLDNHLVLLNNGSSCCLLKRFQD